MVKVEPRYCPRVSNQGYVKALPLRGYYQKDGYSCGYVCTLMILRHYLGEVNAAALYKRLGTTPEGTSQKAIVRELQAAGLSVEVCHDIDFTRLRQAIDKGKLVIGHRDRKDHWIVLYGYGTEPNRVLTADPSPWSYSICSWEKIGADLQNFGIVCSKRD